jgi:hypothetical protein
MVFLGRLMGKWEITRKFLKEKSLGIVNISMRISRNSSIELTQKGNKIKFIRINQVQQ